VGCGPLPRPTWSANFSAVRRFVPIEAMNNRPRGLVWCIRVQSTRGSVSSANTRRSVLSPFIGILHDPVNRS